MPLIDFRELSGSSTSAPRGETFEGLLRELGKRLDLLPEWSGRGADQGRDLLFRERRVGAIGSQEIRWLVSCKDFAQSGRAVSEADVGTIIEKTKQHSAHGFLLATTTTASTGLKAMLDSLAVEGELETKVWDRHELEDLLLKPSQDDILKRFFPGSYSAYKKLSSLPQALDSLKLLLPSHIYSKVLLLIEAYHSEDKWLVAEKIWPYDEESSATISNALESLLEKHEVADAAAILSTGHIEFDAFDATLKILFAVKPEQCKKLCRAIVALGDNEGRSLHAFKFFVDAFEPNNDEQISLAACLALEDLRQLYFDELYVYIQDQVLTNATEYEAWSTIDTLSSATTLEDVSVNNIDIMGSENRDSLIFEAELTVYVGLVYDRERVSSQSLDGQLVGYINGDGMHVTTFTVSDAPYRD